MTPTDPAARVRRMATRAVEHAPTTATADHVPPPDDRDAPIPVVDMTESPARPRWSRPVSALVSELLAFAKSPRWSWGFPQLDRCAPVPLGSLVYVVGATGRGKSSFAIQIAREHVRRGGVGLIGSAELAGLMVGGRIVSQSVPDASWFDAITGRIDESVMRAALDIDGLRIVDEIGLDWQARLEGEIHAIRAESPGRPLLAVIDYLQILPADGRDIRERVTATSTALRLIAKRHQIVILGIVKGSRAAAKAIRSGEMVGSDATEAGAETNAIEHDAIAKILLGAMRPANPDNPSGPVIIDVSVAKARFGTPDVVIPFRGDLARGTFVEDGEAVPASERKAAAKNDQIADKVRECLADESKPITRTALATAVGGNKAKALEAIRAAINAGVVVAVNDPDPDCDPRSSPVMLRSTAETKGFRRPPPGTPASAPWGAP